MKVYFLNSQDVDQCLYAMSQLFLVEESPKIIIGEKMPENLTKYYDLELAPYQPKKCHAERIAVYDSKDKSLAVAVFSWLVGQGYLVVNSEQFSRFQQEDQEILYLGSKSQEQGGRCFDRSSLARCQNSRRYSTYVIINSADLESEYQHVQDADRYWCPGLSLVGAYGAAYLQAGVYDVMGEHAPAQVEKKLHEIESLDTLLVVGSAGQLPFIVTDMPNFGLGNNAKTDVIRDYTLWQQDFAGGVQGRILAKTLIDGSLLFLRPYLETVRKERKKSAVIVSDSHTCLEEMGVAAEVPTLRITCRTVASRLRSCDFDTHELYGEDNNCDKILQYLPDSDFFFIANHGISAYLRTGGHSLGAGDLTEIPPLQAFCLSCLTTRLKGIFLSGNEIDWKCSSVPVELSIPMQILAKGASLFLGLLNYGLEVESNIVFVTLFSELILQGETVGCALQKARNTLLAQNKAALFAVDESQLSYYRLSEVFCRFTFHELQIYGNPSMRLTSCQYQKNYQIAQKGNQLEVHIDIPEESWQMSNIPVQGLSQNAYYTRRFEAAYPVIPEAVLMPGELCFIPGTPVDKNLENGIAEKSFERYAFQVKIPLQPGQTIRHISLDHVEILDNENDKAGELWRNLSIRDSHYHAPNKVDIGDNWPFAVVKEGDGEEVWLFLPTAIVDESKKTLLRMRNARMTAHCEEGVQLSGKITTAFAGCSSAYITLQDEQGHWRSIATDEQGYYSLTMARGMYRMSIAAPYHITRKEKIELKEDSFCDIALVANSCHKIDFEIKADDTGNALPGVIVEILPLIGSCREKMIQDYVKSKEIYPLAPLARITMDQKGQGQISLPSGAYILDIYYRAGVHARYRRIKDYIIVHENNRKEITLEPVATLEGQLVDKESGKGIPDGTVLVKYIISQGKQSKEKFLRFHSDMQGRFAFAVPSDVGLSAISACEGYEIVKHDSIQIEAGCSQKITLVCQKKY